jgi:hypothetical protein
VGTQSYSTDSNGWVGVVAKEDLVLLLGVSSLIT